MMLYSKNLAKFALSILTLSLLAACGGDDADTPQKSGNTGSFEFGAASYSIGENGGVIEITINRLGGSDGAVTIDWMTQGVTATFAEDYGDFSWTPLSFADGETSRVETISIVNDALEEDDEIFNVLLGNPTGGASVGTVATTAVTIVNDDSSVSQPGRFEFDAASYSIGEDGDVVAITINRLDGSDGTVTIDWMTQGDTATSAEDYGDLNWTSLSFADRVTSRTETISIVNDVLEENNEIFNVLLSNPTGGASLGTVTTTEVTIVDNDGSSQSDGFEFGATSYSVDENGVEVEITINRLGSDVGTVTVDWATENVTASFVDDDYVEVDWTTLTFADGETSKVETISIIDDSSVEKNEVFNVLLGHPTSGNSVDEIATTAVTIVNDDTSFEFGATNYAVNEDSDTVEITIDRLGRSDSTVTVNWMTEDVTAASGLDYVSVSPTLLSFADGETSRVVTISILDDSSLEANEVFNVRLDNPTGGALVDTVGTTAVTIVNIGSIEICVGTELLAHIA